MIFASYEIERSEQTTDEQRSLRRQTGRQAGERTNERKNKGAKSITPLVASVLMTLLRHKRRAAWFASPKEERMRIKKTGERKNLRHSLSRQPQSAGQRRWLPSGSAFSCEQIVIHSFSVSSSLHSQHKSSISWVFLPSASDKQTKHKSSATNSRQEDETRGDADHKQLAPLTLTLHLPFIHTTHSAISDSTRGVRISLPSPFDPPSFDQLLTTSFVSRRLLLLFPFTNQRPRH